jgi:MerR HTH family regulatory protein
MIDIDVHVLEAVLVEHHSVFSFDELCQAACTAHRLAHDLELSDTGLALVLDLLAERDHLRARLARVAPPSAA